MRKVVSERLNCSASACILAASSNSASSKTQRGLPLNGLSPCVKTLTIRYEYEAMDMRAVLIADPTLTPRAGYTSERAFRKYRNFLGFYAPAVRRVRARLHLWITIARNLSHRRATSQPPARAGLLGYL